MNYYYDIVLNFLEDNYQFYEVLKDDTFDNIKKIPIIQVSNKQFKEISSNYIKVTKDFLKRIHNETTTDTSSIAYATLIADKNSVIALEFSSDGTILARSQLSLNDELSILDIIYTVEIEELSYQILKPIIYNKTSRQEQIIKNLIHIEIETLYKEKNFPKMQFLYMEWFGKLENNNELMYQKMLNKLNKEITPLEEKIYQIIKLSYNNV